jgi:hypothetical protein
MDAINYKDYEDCKQVVKRGSLLSLPFRYFIRTPLLAPLRSNWYHIWDSATVKAKRGFKADILTNRGIVYKGEFKSTATTGKSIAHIAQT